MLSLIIQGEEAQVPISVSRPVQSWDTTPVRHPSPSPAAVVEVPVSVSVPVSVVATPSVQVPAFVPVPPPTPVAAPAPTPTSAPAVTPLAGPRPVSFVSNSRGVIVWTSSLKKIIRLVSTAHTSSPYHEVVITVL